MNAASLKPSMSADFSLPDSFKSNVKHVIDDAAPFKERKKTGRSKAPWEKKQQQQQL